MRKHLATLLILITSTTSAQWQLVAPPNTIRSSGIYGQITHIEDVLWAGHTDIRMSTDLGVTWQVRTPSSFTQGDYISSISFLNKQTGLFATAAGYLYSTLDAGMSWQKLYTFSRPILCAAFMGSPDRFAFSSQNGYIYTTIDGGANWGETQFGRWVTGLAWGPGNTLYAIGENSSVAGLYKTTNYGQTWAKQPGSFDWDSYTFVLDSCEPPAFYVVNEEIIAPVDFFSSIYVSKDEGITWVSKDAHAINQQAALNYHCGSIVIGGNAIFAQTYTGITRSTDHGSTWKEIGGPPNTWDTRFVTALSENTIFAVGKDGSVWRTFNSGGDSVRGIGVDSVYLFPDTLFAKTDTYTCEDSASGTLHFSFSGCEVKQIASATIEGSDSAVYRINSTSPDSISSLFKPLKNRDYSATLVVTLSDGSIHRVPMIGRGKMRDVIVVVTPTTTLFVGDTITKCEHLIRSFHITVSGCPSPHIVSESILGSAPGDYKLIRTLTDSLNGDNIVDCDFGPTQQGYRSAVYTLTLDGGRSVIVPLEGNGRGVINIGLALPTSFHTDTIGGLVSVPIIIKGLDKPRDVEMTLHFDNGLVYTNTSLGAKTFDVAGTLTNNSVRIFISAADINLGAVSAYANFTIFPDSASSWNVRFDSLSVPSLGVQCQDMTNSFSATLTGPAGCGISTLTHYVRTGKITLNAIIPNPTSGGIDVSFALPADDGVTFELINSLGATTRSLANKTPMTKGSHILHFDLANEPAGNYFVKMTTASGEELTQKCIISK